MRLFTGKHFPATILCDAHIHHKDNNYFCGIKYIVFKSVKVIVEYERIPYVSKLGNVRITFDVNLCSSTDVSEFLNGNYKKRPVMPKDTLLMEVKWDDFLPDTIYRALSIENLKQTAFSKYCLCRRFCLGFALNKILTKGELNL